MTDAVDNEEKLNLLKNNYKKCIPKTKSKFLKFKKTQATGYKCNETLLQDSAIYQKKQKEETSKIIRASDSLFYEPINNTSKSNLMSNLQPQCLERMPEIIQTSDSEFDRSLFNNLIACSDDFKKLSNNISIRNYVQKFLE